MRHSNIACLTVYQAGYVSAAYVTQKQTNKQKNVTYSMHSWAIITGHQWLPSWIPVFSAHCCIWCRLKVRYFLLSTWKSIIEWPSQSSDWENWTNFMQPDFTDKPMLWYHSIRQHPQKPSQMLSNKLSLKMKVIYLDRVRQWLLMHNSLFCIELCWHCKYLQIIASATNSWSLLQPARMIVASQIMKRFDLGIPKVQPNLFSSHSVT